LNYWSIGYTQAHFDSASLGAAGTLAGSTTGGWFIGGGLEVAMHGGWFWRSEVRYADYSKDVRSESGVAPALNVNFDPVVETATSEIVYKFNWGH
jgi:outer membrane immunogenic protein